MVAQRVGMELANIHPRPPALRLFDAGVGDGTVLTRVMRAMHDRFPTMPFYIVGKEISLEDVRLVLEKMPDRLFEHPATVLVMTNMYYSEAPWLKPNSVTAATSLVWHELALTGNTAHEFEGQITDLAPFLAEHWRARMSKQRQPGVREAGRPGDLSRGPQVPTRSGAPRGAVHADTTWSSPRSRIAPARRSSSRRAGGRTAGARAGPGGRLIAIHSHGDDPGLEIIQRIWPGENPFITDRHALLRATKPELGSRSRDLNFSAYADERSLFRYDMHTLPSEISVVDRHLHAVRRLERRGLRGADRGPAPVGGNRQRRYLEATKAVLREHGGLWFLNESYVDLAQPLRAMSDSEALHAEAARLMRGFSVEQTPAELAKRAGFPADLPAGTRVYLTWIPGAPFERTLGAAVRVRELGMTPVPHLAARAIADAAALGRMLGELRREAGVEHLLLIAGSQRIPAGAYADSLQLLATGRFDGPPWRSLGFAAHPEGSPEIGALALSRALAAKSAHAAATSLPHELVTQFGFAAAPLIASRKRPARGRQPAPAGAGRPRRLGLDDDPVALRRPLRRQRPWREALLRHGGRSLRLTGAVAPGRLVAAVARASLADPDARFSGFHFYPFGSLDATVEWAAAIAAGEFTLDVPDRELVVV